MGPARQRRFLAARSLGPVPATTLPTARRAAVTTATHAVRCKLTCERYKIEALLFDGLRIADPSGYLADAHSELAKSILETARIECEKVAPGIKMVWAWKAPDFTVANEAKQIVCSLESGQPA